MSVSSVNATSGTMAAAATVAQAQALQYANRFVELRMPSRRAMPRRPGKTCSTSSVSRPPPRAPGWIRSGKSLCLPRILPECGMQCSRATSKGPEIRSPV